MTRSALVASSAAILLLLGLVHLAYTFHGAKLQPRDPELMARMKSGSPVVSPQTTIWRVWVGVNATHSFCLIFFGAVYGYLATCHSQVLFDSWFLLTLGLVLLLVLVAISYVYFFRAPLVALIVATVLYLAGVIVHRN